MYCAATDALSCADAQHAWPDLRALAPNTYLCADKTCWSRSTECVKGCPTTLAVLQRFRRDHRERGCASSGFYDFHWGRGSMPDFMGLCAWMCSWYVYCPGAKRQRWGGEGGAGCREKKKKLKSKCLDGTAAKSWPQRGKWGKIGAGAALVTLSSQFLFVTLCTGPSGCPLTQQPTRHVQTPKNTPLIPLVCFPSHK